MDFYPKFGFEKKPQHQFFLPLNHAAGAAQQLDMDAPQDRQRLLDAYKKQNPFSKIQTVNGEGLLMFYCIGPMKDCVYSLPDFDAVVIAGQEDDAFHCYDVYCEKEQSLPDILAAAAAPGTRTAYLEFTPKDRAPFETRLIPDEEDALFVLRDTAGLFDAGPLLFPVISHT